MKLKNTSLLVLLLMLTFLSCTSKTEQEQINADLLPIHSYHFVLTSLDISEVSDNSRATFWKPDGSLMFVTGRFTENVAVYSISVPWDLSTAAFHSEFNLPEYFSENTGLSVAHGLYLKDTGRKMYVFNRTEIWAFELIEPWDITTAETLYTQDLSDFVQRGHDIDFHPSGEILYIDDRNARAVHQVNLSTPWDIRTMTWDYTLDISDMEKEVRGIEFVKDGSIMLLLDTVRKELMQYHLEEPWNIRTARYVNSLDLSSISNDPRGLSISRDLSKIYITAREQKIIYQLELEDQ